MIQFNIHHDNQTIGFATLENANAYKIENNITSEIEEVEIIEKVEDLEVKTQQYLERIGVEVAKLNRSALRRAIGKEASRFDYLTDKDLNDLKDVTYPRKKQLAENYLANGTITNQTLFDSMFNVECEIDFAGEKLHQTIAYLNSEYSGQGVSIPTTGLTRMQSFCYIVLTKFALGSYLYEELIMKTEAFRITSLTRLDNLQFDKLDAGFAMLKDLHLIEDVEGFNNLMIQFNAL